MPECPNCQEAVKHGWEHCPHCGANLKRGKYSSNDDPTEALRKKVDDIDNFLTEKFPEDVNADENENDDEPKPRKKSAAKKKRRTLFGD